MPPKRDLCRYYLQGTCFRRAKCNFIHDPTDAIQPSPTARGGHRGARPARSDAFTSRSSPQGSQVKLSPPLDDDFPAPAAIAAKTSDGLLRPTKYHSELFGATTALASIVDVHRRHLDSVKSAENLLFIVNSVNATNIRWVGLLA
jgi:hypothetical protein